MPGMNSTPQHAMHTWMLQTLCTGVCVATVVLSAKSPSRKGKQQTGLTHKVQMQAHMLVHAEPSA